MEDESLENAFDNLPYGSKLLDILSVSPPQTKVRFTFRKGEPVKTEPQDAAGLLRSFREKQDNCPWCRKFWKENRSQRHADSLTTFYLEEYFLELDKDWTEFLPEKPRKKARLAGGDELKCLYYTLDEKLRVFIIEGKISMESEPPFPELGLAALSLEEEVPDVNPEDIRRIMEYLESGDSEYRDHVKSVPVPELTDINFSVVTNRSSQSALPTLCFRFDNGSDKNDL